MSDQYSLVRQQTLDWLKESGYSRGDLAKELNWSESFMSEFMAEKCGLSGLNLCLLTNAVSQPPRVNKINKGARICGIQKLGKAVKGVLELHADRMNDVKNAHTKELASQRKEFNAEVYRTNGGFKS